MNDPEQANAWSQVADGYELEFIDPWLPDTDNPLPITLEQLANKEQIVADLGCGIGPLLPLLSKNFQKVYAVDFAPEMLRRAREACPDLDNVEFVQTSLTSLDLIPEPIHVGVAVNSLVLPHPTDLKNCLSSVYDRLLPGGTFLGIVPAMDAVHYHTMLLVDRALERGMPLDAAKKNAWDQNELDFYDLGFGEFRYRDLVQHFWHPFEVEHRLRQAGFIRIQTKKVILSWSQFAQQQDLKQYPPPWDWFFLAKKSRRTSTK